MDIRISGIDTSDSNVVCQYLNTTTSLYPNYQNVQVNVINASTLEILLS